MNKKFIWLSALALACSLTQASFACSGSEHTKNWSAHHRFDKLSSELNLSEEQKAKMKDYREQAHASLKANFTQLKSLRGQISAIVKADKIDESKLDSLVAQISKIKASMLKSRILMQHQLYSILTEQQRQHYQDLMNKWQQKHNS